jgi:hypothetical protein
MDHGSHYLRPEPNLPRSARLTRKSRFRIAQGRAGGISALSSLSELPMTNTQLQILDFLPPVTPHEFSGLKIGH